MADSSTSLGGKVKRVRIYVNEGDRVGHVPAPLAIVEFLRKEGASGATVLRGVEGFGGTGVLHQSSLGDLVERLPVVIEWLDAGDRAERLLPRIKEMVIHGLITVEDTEVVHYAIRPVKPVSNHVAVAEVMSRDVTTVAEDTHIRSVVELMLGKVYRAIPVVSEGRPVGIITNSDLVVRAGLGARIELLPRLDASELGAQLDRLTADSKTAGQIMTPSPVTVSASARLPEAAGIMTQRRLKRLPVVDASGQLVGMISRLDLLRTVGQVLSRAEGTPREIGLDASATLAQVMRKDVPSVRPETAVAEVLQAVASTRLNRVVVTDEERHVLGIVTDAEVLERTTPALRPNALRSLMHRLPFARPSAPGVSAEHHGSARVARELMRTDVPIAKAETALRDAIAPMLRGREKLIAVVDDSNRLVGIVDRADILHAIVAPGR